MEWLTHIQPYINGVIAFVSAGVSIYVALKVKTVYVLVNSRMDAFLKSHASINRIEGKNEGRAEILAEIAMKSRPAEPRNGH